MLHPPQPREIVLKFDQPWEGLYCGYETVLKDGDVFRFYYRGMPVRAAYAGRGSHVRRGEPRRHPLDAAQAGLVRGAGYEGQQRRPGAPSRLSQLRAVYRCESCRPGRPAVQGTRRDREPGLIAFASPDGIHWRELQPEPVITKGAFDSQNNAFWSESEKQYVCYFRVFRDGIRWIARTTSQDFIHWTEPVDLELDGKPRQHLYTNQIDPYCSRTASLPGAAHAVPAGPPGGDRGGSPPHRHADGVELRQRLHRYPAGVGPRRGRFQTHRSWKRISARGSTWRTGRPAPTTRPAASSRPASGNCRCT